MVRRPLAIFIASFGLIACSDESSETQHLVPATGVFIDSPVSGLGYQTPSRSGKTDSSGEFKYLPGERVDFFVGDIELGGALGQAVITPLTLVAEAANPSHPKVTNIVRLLMTLDNNGNAEDGIALSTETVDAAKGLSIDVGGNNFSMNPDLTKLLASLPTQPVLVEAATAQAHLTASLTSQSTWGVMVWGQGTWQAPDFLTQQSSWGLMRWSKGAWQRATNTDL